MEGSTTVVSVESLRERLFALAADEVYRVGYAEPGERRQLRRLLQMLKVPADAARAILLEAKAKGLERPQQRPFDAAGLCRRAEAMLGAAGAVGDTARRLESCFRILFTVDDVHHPAVHDDGSGMFALPGASPPEPLGDDDGMFERRELIGQGGMGRVYRGWDRSLERDVAIKVVSPHLAGDDEFVERFKREARLAARVHHENLVAIFLLDTDRMRGCPFLVMEYVDGESLRDYLRREGPLTPERTVDILVQICEGLRAALERGILHRDVKPGNVMLTRERTAKVTDFGLARSLACPGRGLYNGVVGTAHYLSPEAARGKPVDHRSDMYSLGVTAFELLTGRFPFDGWNIEGLVAAHCNQPVPSLLERRPEVPPRLVAVVERLLAKSPDDRFATYTDLIEALEASLADEPQAPPRAVQRRRSERSVTPWRSFFAELRRHLDGGGGPSAEHRAALAEYRAATGLVPLAKLIGPFALEPHHLLVATETAPVGRHEASTVVLNDETLRTGRWHGRFTRRPGSDGRWFVQRRPGADGSPPRDIAVNGYPLGPDDTAQLFDGDQVSFNETVRLGVRIPAPTDDRYGVDLYVEELPAGSVEYKHRLRWTLFEHAVLAGGGPDCQVYLADFEDPTFTLRFADGIFWLEPPPRPSLDVHLGWKPLTERCPLYHGETIHIGGYEYLFYQLRKPEELWLWDDELGARDVPR